MGSFVDGSYISGLNMACICSSPPTSSMKPPTYSITRTHRGRSWGWTWKVYQEEEGGRKEEEGGGGGRGGRGTEGAGGGR